MSKTRFVPYGGIITYDSILKNRKKRKKKDFFITCLFITILAIAIVSYINMSFNDTTYLVTITDKERIVENSGDMTTSKYLVFGNNNMGQSVVFENTDNMFRRKYNSSNIQGQLEIGKTYKLTVIGYRIPFLSMYENIIKIEEVKYE